MNGLDEYRVVRLFECYGNIMVVVEAPHGTHTMEKVEWESISRDLERKLIKTSKCCYRKENNVA